MVKRIPVYQAKVSDELDSGILAMSFVDFPAVERNFVALKNVVKTKLTLNKQKKILTGVVLVPDQLIYRNQEPLGEYYMRFSAAEIEKISQKMMRTGIALYNTTHQHDKQLDSNYLTELWIVTDPERDKSIAVGLGKLPKGTLCASYKIEDGAYWQNEVMTGNVKGFSLEGFFNLNNVTIMKKTVKTAAKPAAKKGGAIVSFLKSVTAMLEGDTEAATEDLADVAAEDETDSGEPYLIFELAEGGEAYVDEEGYVTLNDEPMPAGQHALADGNFLVVDDSGMMVITQPEAEGGEPAAADTELKKQEAKDRAAAYLASVSGKKPAKTPATTKTVLAGLKKPDANTTKIKALEAEIAKLKKQPSVGKATPKVTSVALDANASFTDRAAQAIRAQRERMGK